MYRLNKDRARDALKNKITKKKVETHYLFGRNDVFSFEEDESIYAIIDIPDEKSLLIHDFTSMGKKERRISEIEESAAIEFLEKTGHSPFMRLDIEKYIVEIDDSEIIVDKVEQLGFFTDSEDLGSENVNYGELLKKQMIEDTEKEKEIRREAQEILRST